MELSDQDIVIANNNNKNRQKVESERRLEKILDWLKEKNLLDVEKVRSSILERLDLLSVKSKFVDDEKTSIKYAEILFDFYREHKPKKVFSDEEKKIVELGIIFSDIGKSGPLEANREQQELIIRIFGIENVKNTEQVLEKIIREKFPNTAEEDLELLKQLGIDPIMLPIKDFWRLHSRWTKEIIEDDGVPHEAIPAAVLHHVFEGDNNYLMDEEGNYIGEFGGPNRRFDRVEKLVVILDKYDAFRSRLGLNHKEALDRIREIVKTSERFKDDSEFLELIEDVEIACQTEGDD